MTVAENNKNSAAKYALETNVVEKRKTRGKFPNIETRKGKSLMYNNFFYFFSPWFGNVFIITRFACWIKVILDYLLKICYNLFVRPSKVLAFQAFIILTSLAVDTLKYSFLYDSKNASCTRDLRLGKFTIMLN